MPRYVILEHDWPTHHYDLMLENGSVLRTWRLAALPIINGVTSVEPIGDHRLIYLEYEGPVSGGRGSVKRYDAGEYVVVGDNSQKVTLQLHGQQLNGVITLVDHAKK